MIGKWAGYCGRSHWLEECWVSDHLKCSIAVTLASKFESLLPCFEIVGALSLSAVKNASQDDACGGGSCALKTEG